MKASMNSSNKVKKSAPVATKAPVMLNGKSKMKMGGKVGSKKMC